MGWYGCVGGPAGRPGGAKGAPDGLLSKAILTRTRQTTSIPRRMLSCWVPHKRPLGAPRMTYGRTVGKALDVFDIDRKRWPELAADRAAWRSTLQSGEPPSAFRATPPTPAALPLAFARARRSTLAATNAKIDQTVRTLRG